MLSPQEIVSLLKLDGLVEELEKLDDFGARVEITLRTLQKFLPLDMRSEQKDNELSKKLRKQADSLIFKQKGKFEIFLKAREIYTESIARAEELSLELAQAYANRSSTLFHLKMHNECIRDIERALKLTSYPDHLRANLIRRKAKCLKLLGNPESEKVCEEARILLQDLNLKDEAKETLEVKIDSIADLTLLHEQELKEAKIKKKSAFKFNPNRSITSASDAIYIKHNKDFGKHLVADRDIEPGEVLIAEKPYASNLNSTNLYTHCSECFVRAWDSIPCDHCVYAMYCSENCKTKAWQQYHDIECSIRGYLQSLSIQDTGVFSLKLAILAVRESGSIHNLKRELNKVDRCDDSIMKCLSSDGNYHSDKYKALYSLDGRASSRNKPEILMISLNTAFILYYLFTLTSFFGDNSDATVSKLCENKNAIFLGKLIAHHITIIHMNDHEFSEFRDDNYNGIGSVIGPVASLLNHSCDPNVARCCIIKDKVVQQVFYAIRPINQGSQLLDDYGCHFAFNTKTTRETFLKRYFFQCTCAACVEIWPVLNELPSIMSIVKEKKSKLVVARAIVRSKEFQRLFAKLGIDKYEGNKTDILSSLARSISILSENAEKPSREFYEMIQLFRQAFCAIFGNNFHVHDPMCVCC